LVKLAFGGWYLGNIIKTYLLTDSAKIWLKNIQWFFIGVEA
jgi:hypothetical protein